MKKKMLKQLAILLTTCMCLGSARIDAFATELSDDTITITNEITEEEGLEEIVDDAVTEEAATEEEAEISLLSVVEEVVEEPAQTGWDGVTTEAVIEKEDYRLTFTLTGYWDGGYNADVRIDNLKDKAIEDWKLIFNYPGAINHIWNAQIISEDEDGFFIKHAGWNQDIPKDGCVQFGFQGHSDFNGFPTDCKIIGKLVETPVEDYTITSEITADWGFGYTALVTIANNTAADIEDWVLEFDCEDDITSLFDGVIISHEGSHYVVKNPDYSQNILANGKISFGFLVSFGNSENGFLNIELKKYDIEEEPVIKMVEISGAITNALNGRAVPEVLINVREGEDVKEGDTYTSMLSEDGSFAFTLPEGEYTVEFIKEGFVTEYYNFTVSEEGDKVFPIVMTPILVDKEYRVVLTWTKGPNDLDSYLIYNKDNKEYKLWYSSKTIKVDGETIATLDRDITNVSGTGETVTFTFKADMAEGDSFTYFVRNYTGKNNKTNPNVQLSASNAVVKIYNNDGLIQEIALPEENNGVDWIVFKLTNEELTIIDTVVPLQTKY